MTLKNRETIPRPEYPRPQFKRENNWINLNGEWDFTFDDDNVGLKEKWYKKDKKEKFDKKIIVPFCFQSELSGIGDPSFHDVVWYRREFELPHDFNDNRVLLHFGAVDYCCSVYLNGEFVGNHEGGYIGFSVNITDFIENYNVLVLRVEDPSTDLEILRGKQYWFEKASGIFYPRVTGIWQTVWLEFVSLKCYLKWIKFTPDVDSSEIFVECEVYGLGFPELRLSTKISFKDQIIAEEEINLSFLGDIRLKRDRKLLKVKGDMRQLQNPNSFKYKIPIPRDLLYLWDVKNPLLYDVFFKLYNNVSKKNYDEVMSYFGMRKISLSEKRSSEHWQIDKRGADTNLNRQVLLNNKPIYQKLFLVQGYWPDGLYTAPTDDAIKLDIQYIKDFGFNGLRTHQKAFDPRFLYWCDKMGVLVWGEIGNAFQFSTRAQIRLIKEFSEEIERDYNHPSIVVWTVLNEGWGVPGAHKDRTKVDYTASLYHLIKSLDSTRLIVDDDGWYHCQTDLCTIHLYERYESLPKSFEEEIKFHLPSPYAIYLEPYEYNDEPIIYSEIGGYGLDFHGDMEEGAWSYRNVSSGNELLEKVVKLLKIFDERKAWIHGFCYTELYDQFQEINGLLTMSREPKFEPSRLKNELDKMFY